LSNGGASDFGSVAVGSSSTLTFLVRNTGTANLTGLSVSIDGRDAAAFALSAPLTSVLISPGGNATFSIQFAAPTAGAKLATLHITSNDPAQNPFNLLLNGVGTTVVINPGSDSVDGPLFPPGAAALLLCLTGLVGCRWILKGQSP
jgi:hypothetical protein